MENVKVPYPAMYPRVVDFIPLLGLQAHFDADLELSVFEGTASVALNPTIRSDLKNKDHDILFKQNAINRQHTDVEYIGDPNNTIRQKDIWSDTEKTLALKVPEVNIQRRVMITEISTKLSGEPALSGCSHLSLEQRGVGNFYGSIRRRFGLSYLSNPYQIIKGDLIDQKEWQPEIARHLRSILKTDKILAGDGGNKGWSDLFKPKLDTPHAFPPFAGQLNHEFVKDRWWSDVAIPRKLLGQVDGGTVEAVVYYLSNRGRVIAL